MEYHRRRPGGPLRAEYHDRPRDLHGRFDRGYDILTDQLHIRCTRTEGQMIRDAALRQGFELSAWCRAVLMLYAEEHLTENG